MLASTKITSERQRNRDRTVPVSPFGMTAEAPDPRTFKTWQDAFQYPVPIVRKLELQLRSNVNENREKLRTLVG